MTNIKHMTKREIPNYPTMNNYWIFVNGLYLGSCDRDTACSIAQNRYNYDLGRCRVQVVNHLTKMVVLDLKPAKN